MVWGENWRWCATRSQQESGQGRDWPQWRPQATCRCQCHSFLAPVQNRPARGQHGNISPPACKHPDHQGPAPHNAKSGKTIVAKAAQVSTFVSTHWATHVTTIHTAKSPTVGSQVSCNSLACVSFSSSSTSSKIALKHLGPHSGTFASLTMASDLSHSLACGRPASQPDSKLFKIFQNMSQHVSTIFKNNIFSSSFYAHWQTCHQDWPAMASLLTETTLAGQNKIVPQKTSTANTCIQHTVAFLSCPCEDAWPCLAMFCLRSGGILVDFAPSFHVF